MTESLPAALSPVATTAQAGKFFQAAYDAAKLVEGHFSLYTGGYPDKQQNYVDVFLKQNSEDIFLRQYSQ